MTEPDAKRRRRGWWKYLLAVTASVILLLAGISWYATTDSFQRLIRRRMVAELERVTGGRVDLGSLHTIPFRLQIDVRDLTIHGTEPASEVPYVHLDRLVAQIKIISLLETDFGFSSIVLDHPVVHIIVHPDGTTNQPSLRLKSSGRSPLEQLFSLSISRLEVRRGELLWNQQSIPLDFVANDVSANMAYSVLHQHYSANLLVGKINTKVADYRPIAWMAEAHFSLAPDEIGVSSFKATSGHSKLQANGRLVNFHDPNLVGDYDATVDLQEAAAILRVQALKKGTAEFAGHGSWSMASFSSIGKLLVKDFDWSEESLTLQAASLASPYKVDQQRLEFSDIQAKLMGGAVTGAGEVSNWLVAREPGAARRKGADQQKGIVRLKLKDLSAQEIATAFASGARPLQRANLAGIANGTLESHWRGSLSNAETEIAVDVLPPSQPAPGKVPVSAHAQGTYRATLGEWQVDELRANTRASHLVASGTLSKRASLKLSITTSDLGEWEPLFNASGYQEHSPATLRGHASFTGTASGKISEIAFAGKLQSQDLSTVIPETETRPQESVHWDSFAADVQLSPEMFAIQHGALRHGETAITFDAIVNLDKRRFTNQDPFRANVQMQNADLSEILALAGYDSAATGKLNLSLMASGTRGQPQGQGSIQLSDAVVRGESIQRLDSGFSFNGEQVSLQDIRVAQDQAHITGEGTYDFVTRAFRLSLHGENFDLARFSPLQQTRIAIGGRMEFDAQSSGSLDEPIINAKLHLHDLSFNGERAGDYLLDANTQGAELRISGRSQFKDAELDIDGNVHLRDTWPASVNLHFNHLDVNPVLTTYLGARVTGPSAAAGDLQLIGPLKDPAQLQIVGNVSELFADLAHIQVRNNGPIRFSVLKQILDIQQLRLIGPGTDLTVGGKARLAGDFQLDLRADGHADLTLLQSFDSDFTASGLVSVHLTATGPVRRPAILGQLQISEGSIQYSDLPSALSGINGSLAFNQDRLQIETLTAHVGGGLVNFGGYASVFNRQLNFDLNMKAQDVRLRYPPGVSSMTDAEVRWAGSSAESVLSGNATITKLAVTPGFDFGSYLARSAQAAALPQTNPLLNRIRIDVHIQTTPELQMQTASVRLTGDADFRLRGTAAKSVLLGRADVIEGDVYFNGTKYRLERGDVSFSNPVTTTPVLDLQASTKVREYEITLNLNGEVDKLNLSYHSEPPLPTADIISLLALGQTQEQSAQLQQAGGSPIAQQATSAVLNEAINSALSNRSQRLFGISHIKIDPQGLNAETIPTQNTPLPAVTIEQQVRDNITLTYTTNVAQTSQQIIQGEYNITRDVSIVAIRDYNGVVSFEIRLRQRKK